MQHVEKLLSHTTSVHKSAYQISQYARVIRFFLFLSKLKWLYDAFYGVEIR